MIKAYKECSFHHCDYCHVFFLDLCKVTHGYKILFAHTWSTIQSVRMS